MLNNGFVQVTFRSLILGKACDYAFYYTPTPDFPMNTTFQVEILLTALLAQIQEGDEFSFSVENFRQLFTTDVQVTGLDLLGKGTTGIEPLQLRLPLSLPGSRLAADDLLPTNITLSCYAARRFFLGRGAKVGFSGGMELDYSPTDGWLDLEGGFLERVQDFVEEAAPETTLEVPDATASLYPVVVPRIPTVAPSGKPSNRLPVDATDVPITYRISPFDPAPFAGSQNKRKKKPRG